MCCDGCRRTIAGSGSWWAFQCALWRWPGRAVPRQCKAVVDGNDDDARICCIQNSRCASGGRAAIYATPGLRALWFGLVLRHCAFGPVRRHLHCQTGMETMGPGLACKGAKEQHGNQNEKSADLKQHAGRVALTDAAQCRLVLPCCRCSAVNQSLAPNPLNVPAMQIASKLANGEFKTA